MKSKPGVWIFIAILLVILAFIAMFFGVLALIYWCGLLIKYLFKVSFEWNFLKAIASTTLIFILVWIFNIFFKK